MYRYGASAASGAVLADARLPPATFYGPLEGEAARQLTAGQPIQAYMGPPSDHRRGNSDERGGIIGVQIGIVGADGGRGNVIIESPGWR